MVPERRVGGGVGAGMCCAGDSSRVKVRVVWPLPAPPMATPAHLNSADASALPASRAVTRIDATFHADRVPAEPVEAPANDTVTLVMCSRQTPFSNVNVSWRPGPKCGRSSPGCSTKGSVSKSAATGTPSVAPFLELDDENEAGRLPCTTTVGQAGPDMPLGSIFFDVRVTISYPHVGTVFPAVNSTSSTPSGCAFPSHFPHVNTTSPGNDGSNTTTFSTCHRQSSFGVLCDEAIAYGLPSASRIRCSGPRLMASMSNDATVPRLNFAGCVEVDRRYRAPVSWCGAPNKVATTPPRCGARCSVDMLVNTLTTYLTLVGLRARSTNCPDAAIS
eukprot:m.1584284 g.1584284  ORF g.1584284 m.1584284 type:complete len:332 (-) comp25320_c0_seq49:1165-2160(-)